MTLDEAVRRLDAYLSDREIEDESGAFEEEVMQRATDEARESMYAMIRDLTRTLEAGRDQMAKVVDGIDAVEYYEEILEDALVILSVDDA